MATEPLTDRRATPDRRRVDRDTPDRRGGRRPRAMMTLESFRARHDEGVVTVSDLADLTGLSDEKIRQDIAARVLAFEAKSSGISGKYMIRVSTARLYLRSLGVLA